MKSIANAEHYVWGDACEGWHLVKTPELSVIQERVPPGRSEVRHRHARARQFFYVLRGEATLEREGEVVRLRAGQGLEVAPGEAHQLRNLAAEPLEFIVVSQPPSHADRSPA